MASMVTLVALVVCQANIIGCPLCTLPGVAEKDAVGAGGGAAGGAGPTACCTADFDPPPQPASRINGNKNFSLTLSPCTFVLPTLSQGATFRDRSSPPAGNFIQFF
jgi:hypothetical protein